MKIKLIIRDRVWVFNDLKAAQHAAIRFCKKYGTEKFFLEAI